MASAPEPGEIVDAFVDIYETRTACPNEAVSIRRALRRSAAATVFASLGSHHPIVLASSTAVEDAGRGAALAEIREKLEVGGFAWAPAAEATGRAAQAALVADRISADDHEALTAPWREALLERPRDVRLTLAPEFAAECAAVEAMQRIVDTFIDQYCAARDVRGEAKLILAALRRLPRITSEHPAYMRSVKAVYSRDVSYGKTVAHVSDLVDLMDLMLPAHDPSPRLAAHGHGPIFTTTRGPGLIIQETDRGDVLDHMRRALVGFPTLWTAAGRATGNAARAALVADLISAEDLDTLSSAWRAVLSDSIGHEDRVALLAQPEHDDWLALRP